MLLLVFATLVSFFAIRQLLVARLEERISESLVQEVEEFQRLVGGNDPRTGQPFGTDYRALFDTYFSRNVPTGGEEFIAFIGERPYRSSGRDRNINVLETNPSLVDRWGTLTEPETGEIETPAGPARYLAVPIASEGAVAARFVVADFVAEDREDVGDAVRIAAGVGLAVISLGSVLAFVASGRVLAPLRELTDTAHAITEKDLSGRIEAEGDDELAELGHTFNAMVDRLEGALSSQRQLLRDVGHELRTPLAIVSGHLEFMGDDPDERADTIELVTDELQRMRRLVEDLLLLARSERPDFLELETVDLESLSWDLLAKARALGDRDWRLERKRAGRIVADRQRLTQAVMNLAQNAVAHTSDGDPITIGAECRAGMAHLWVRDTGTGVAYDDQRRIFERFARGTDGNRYQGTGLGLSIVRAVAVAHGGDVSLDSTAGKGACFQLRVPIDQPEEETPA